MQGKEELQGQNELPTMDEDDFPGEDQWTAEEQGTEEDQWPQAEGTQDEGCIFCTRFIFFPCYNLFYFFSLYFFLTK